MRLEGIVIVLRSPDGEAVKTKSGGHKELEASLEALLTSRKLSTDEVNKFFDGRTLIGQDLWNHFQKWLLTNPKCTFEDYVVAHVAAR